MIEAFLTGLERALATGRDLSGIASVASFFVSRVDTEVDRRLDKIGTERRLRCVGWEGAIASARLVYQRYEQPYPPAGGSRWRRAGARPRHPLWASTGVKDPPSPTPSR